MLRLWSRTGRHAKLSLSVWCVLTCTGAMADLIGIATSNEPGRLWDSTCRVLNESVFAVGSLGAIPMTNSLGVGWIVNPATPAASDFVLHDHHYVAAYVPDPVVAVVTFEYDQPVVVDSLAVMQHGNGISRVEGFVGNSPGSLQSIGSVFGPSGDITGSNVFPERSTYVFDYGAVTAGTLVQFIVRKTSLSNGWALYRATPTVTVVPEPGTIGLMGLACTVLLFGRRRRC